MNKECGMCAKWVCGGHPFNPALGENFCVPAEETRHFGTWTYSDTPCRNPKEFKEKQTGASAKAIKQLTQNSVDRLIFKIYKRLGWKEDE